MYFEYFVTNNRYDNDDDNNIILVKYFIQFRQHYIIEFSLNIDSNEIENEKKKKKKRIYTGFDKICAIVTNTLKTLNIDMRDI